MIESAASSIAERLNKYTGNKNISIDFVRYRIAEILHVIIIFSVSITISIFTGKTIDTILALIAFGVLRKLSGGFHLKTLEGCQIFTIILVTAITFIHSSNIMLINLVTLLLLIIFSKKKQSYKVISSLLVASNFVIQSEIVAISFLAQSLTLIHLKEVRTYAKKNDQNN
jgi:accessory gene regulator B